MKRSIFLAFAALLVFVGCAKKAEAPLVHPGWSYNTVMYEVNIRQFSPEGTFKGVEAQLPRLAELGVDILWLMPMYQIGVEERKGTLGSYYAISDYKKVNPEFGTEQDFDDLLAAAHAAGFKVILDWVANQTSPDHVWMTEKPADFYERDSLGNAIYEYDWTDTRSLNYENEAVWDAQEDCMKFWLDRGVDGFRCDAAGEMPVKVWERIIPDLRKQYSDAYFLAEAEKPELSAIFDATYAWELHHLMNDMAKGKKGISDLKEYIARDAENHRPEAFRLMFTSNHDENSWSGTEFERMGDAANLMALLCFTLPKGQPLIYTGQEIGLSRRLAFFEKDPVTDWSSNAYTTFFKGLVDLRHNNPALAAGEKGGPLTYLEGYPESVLAFRREVENNSVTVVANISEDPVVLPDGTTLPSWGYSIECK
ncbi:MAG: alpha-amylase [Bacteroidales bacterium]|nr:alpha-amylase [Bacteroidales bacterium]